MLVSDLEKYSKPDEGITSSDYNVFKISNNTPKQMSRKSTIKQYKTKHANCTQLHEKLGQLNPDNIINTYIDTTNNKINFDINKFIDVIAKIKKYKFTLLLWSNELADINYACTKIEKVVVNSIYRRSKI